MKYTYTLVEAAALWTGIDPKEVQKRIDANEQKQAELEHEKRVSDALNWDAEDLAHWHQQEFDCASCIDRCPDWKWVTTEDGDDRRILNCTAGYMAPLSEMPPKPRPVPASPEPCSRSTPSQGEFADMPEFQERLSWLQEAAASQDLPVSKENVRGSDLRAWLSLHFPSHRPAFLYPDQAELEARLEQITKERDDLMAEVASLRTAQKNDAPLSGKSKSSYLNLVGAFLALLATNKDNYYCGKDELLRMDLRQALGRFEPPPGLSESFLEGVFAEAKRRAISLHPELKETAFRKS